MKKKLVYIDLFSGAGGLSEGFRQAGFTHGYSVDNDRWAMNTLRMRLAYWIMHQQNSVTNYSNYVKAAEKQFQFEDLDLKESFMTGIMSSTSEKVISDKTLDIHLRNIRKKIKANNVSASVILGGPPCQAYSQIGRSRMRQTSNPSKDLQRIKLNRSDHRHHLYELYIKIIQSVKPKCFVYENVPGLITAVSEKGRIIELMQEDFKSIKPPYRLVPVEKSSQVKMFNNSFTLRDCIVNAADYGVPQNRKRIIIIGIREDLIDIDDNVIGNLWEKISESKSSRKISVGKAISDLAEIDADSGVSTFIKNGYRPGRPNEYQKEMRGELLNGVINHQARPHMESDLQRYKWYAKWCDKHGKNPTLGDLPEELQPDHKNRKTFIDRFKVQVKNKPASTIAAHIGKDGHYYIHYDEKQNRSLTAREAARLQSFPDNYVFCGPRTHQFKMIGNAVPPKLSHAIATGIKDILS